MTVNGDFQQETPKPRTSKRRRLSQDIFHSKARKIEALPNNDSQPPRTFRLQVRKKPTEEPDIMETKSLASRDYRSSNRCPRNVKKSRIIEYLSVNDFRCKVKDDIVAEGSMFEYLSPKHFRSKARKDMKAEASLLDTSVTENIVESPANLGSNLRKELPLRLSIIEELNNFSSKVKRDISHEAMLIDDREDS